LKLPTNLAVSGSKSDAIKGKYPTSYKNSINAQTAISFLTAKPKMATNSTIIQRTIAGIYHNESS
jgi:hypothetical protein